MSKLQFIKEKIQALPEAINTVQEWQKSNQKVVFSNGCFDLVHPGHITYLAKTSDLADKLVIGLNTDKSVSRLKGEKRPVVDEQSRALLLAALDFVDLVVLFEEDTPYELIKNLQPDVLVKGKDYEPENIVGYDIVKAKGGEIITIDLVEGFSTSNLIEKIKEAY